MADSKDDERYMRQALKQASQGLGNTSPNPMVGALIVDSSGTVAASGYHKAAGSEHAEVLALREAGEKARGATLYVTLEPCAHYGLTPPCVDAIKAAGIARVVGAMEDPDPRVRGKGYESLRAAAIQVQDGVLADEASQLNRMYAQHRTTGKPFVTLKMAQSLDGAIAPRSGERRQLSGKKAASFVRKLRYEHDAVMVGAGTILVDDPQLTVRPFKPRAVPYTRIIVDARGRIPLRAKVTKDQVRAPTIVATTDLVPEVTRQALAKRGIALLECRRDPKDQVDLADLLGKLGERNIVSILCEGGPTLAASLLAGGHVNQLQWLVAPLLLGGDGAISVLGNDQRDIGLRLDGIKRLGEDLLISAQLER